MKSWSVHYILIVKGEDERDAAEFGLAAMQVANTEQWGAAVQPVWRELWPWNMLPFVPKVVTARNLRVGNPPTVEEVRARVIGL